MYRKEDISMPTLHKLIYKFHTILIKIQMELFMELVLIPKFTCERKSKDSQGNSEK